MALADRPKALECFEEALHIFDTMEQSHRKGRANAMANLAEGIVDLSFVVVINGVCSMFDGSKHTTHFGIV